MAAPEFFAIDIGRHTIKLAQIERKGNSANLLTVGSTDTPLRLESVVPSKDKPEEMQLLANAIKSLVDSSGVKTKQVTTSLPESVIFTKLFPGLPYLDPAKFEETVYWEAKQFIPIPMEDAQTDWIEIEKKKAADGKDIMDVMFIAAPREIVESYLYLFEMAGLELIALEVESMALSRVIRFNYPEQTQSVLVVDIGSERTDVCVIYNGRLVFSQSIGTGSDSFSKAIATDFNLQPAQASQYKMKYGVLPNQQDGGKIHNSIKPILEVVLNEIRKILGFIDTRLSYGSPQGIFLSGNGALLPGLPQYMQSTFQLPVSTLDPLNKVKLKGKVEDIRNHISPMGYSVAIGLGLKEE